VLTLPRLHDRIDFIKEQLQGLNYEFFYGIDKQETSLEKLTSEGLYSQEQYAAFCRKPVRMPLGMLCCALGHAAIYKTIIEKGYNSTLILEDDVVPLANGLSFFEQAIQQLPKDYDVFYLGYEKNEHFRLKQKLKRLVYMAWPTHSKLNLTSSIYSNYYPRRIFNHIAKAGFHDCTHAYSVTQKAAQKLLQLQTPVAFNPDNLLAYAISTGQLKGYISYPKMFNQLSAFVNKIPSLTS
jgi:glycosyl transferase family 25